MQNKIFPHILLVFAMIPLSVLSQNPEKHFIDQPTGKENSKNDYSSAGADYKIISSTESFIEIEYYPSYNSSSRIVYNGETFYSLNFAQGISKDLRFSGEPDIKMRQLTLIVPSENNTVSIIDYDVKEINDINLAPVPGYTVADPRKKNFENLSVSYTKNPEFYSKDKFFPEKIASVEEIGTVRENLVGNLVITPYQYNPVTKKIKQFTRVRIRVNFGSAPFKINYKRSSAENELLGTLAVNSGIAGNWTNPRLTNYKNDLPVVNSVLANGDWYKIEIKDNGAGGSEGIYKIPKSFLLSAGINLNNIDPRTIKIYNNGGIKLPDGLNDPRLEDLNETAIYIEGENDGHFDDNDYILFYGKSTNNWAYDTVSNSFSHYLNTYSNSNYYWICLNTPGNGIRMQLEQSENNPNPFIPSSFTEKLFFEPEISNLLDEGTLWLSERIAPGETITWNNTLAGLEANSNILYKIKPASRCLTGNTNYMQFKEENSTVSPYIFPMGNIKGGFTNWIWTDTTSFTINQSQKTNGEQSTLTAGYFASTSDAEGYIDWMEIQYNRRFNSTVNDIIKFESPDINATVEYNISPFSSGNIKVFDISSHNNVKLLQPLSISSGNVRFQKNETSGQLSKYIVTGPNAYKTPAGISGKIPNQNLRGAYNNGASFIIITHNDFLPAAERLKAKRESVGITNPDYLKTEIFTCEQIYNEFSGGVTDAVAIRDFLKHCYEHWQEKPVYVCFLGDGDFDYKNILVNDGNWVPSYEITDPQLNQVDGYTSDDFYTNVSGSNFPDRPDLAHGRIPARTLEQANTYLDKIDCYESGDYNGYWKNKMVFVADDNMTSSGCEGVQHTAQSEELSEFFIPEYIEKIKLYLINYPAVITSQGRRKPGVNADIIKYWNEGCLDMHYIGHGSPEVWAHEYVLEKDVVLSQLNNNCKYPFVTIASCDMAKFDNPVSQSASELFSMTPGKAGIGTFAASRPVYSDENAALMEVLFLNLYLGRDTLLLQKRLGNAVFNAKQVYFDVNALKYMLLADPTIRVQLPRFHSKIDSISGLSNDTMRALSKIKIYGSAIHPDSTFWPDYNGKVFLKIFDVDRHEVTTDECGFVHNVTRNGGIIFAGNQNVINGKFEAEFIVPKDISYLNQNGKIIDYFYNNQADGAGVYKNFIVGGIDPNAPNDTTGPAIKLFLNTRNFRTGDIVNSNFNLIGDLSDESGINTTGTIGHKIEAILDNNENNKFDLTTFYNSDSSYKSGTLQYDFPGIAEGKHTLKVKAFDTYNNPSESEISFTVSSSSDLKVTNVYNFPNPFRDNTSFTFQHNYPGPINIKIKIFTVSGRFIKEIDKDNVTDKFVSIDWSGKDADEETLSNGVYLYKLMVTSDAGTSETQIGKMAVLK